MREYKAESVEIYLSGPQKGNKDDKTITFTVGKDGVESIVVRGQEIEVVRQTEEVIHEERGRKMYETTIEEEVYYGLPYKAIKS